MTDKIIYLFYGIGSEYVLHPIYEKMNQIGYVCIEIDCLKEKDSKKIIKSLRHKKIVFVTSYHLLLDNKNFHDFYSGEINFFGVLEIIQLLKPIKSIYIPHDLTQPLIDKEEKFINLFDIFISPCEPFTSIYSSICNTQEGGWIKYLNDSNLKKQPILNKTVWFVSDFVTLYNYGIKSLFDFMKPIISQQVAVKFPSWKNSDKVEKFFIDQGVSVYKSTANSIGIIKKSDLIITNGLSSINAESYFMGKTTVNIKDRSHYGNFENYMKKLLPNIIYYNSPTEFKTKSIIIQNNEPILEPFKMKKVIKLITN